MICHSCGHDNVIVGGLGREDTCIKCLEDLHVCLNCGFYDKTKSNDCSEPTAEWVQNKSSANFCEFFEPIMKASDLKTKSVSKQEVMNAFDALFKKSK